MKKKTLTAVLREGTGKGDTGRLRRAGKIPAVVYGHTRPQSVAVDEHEFSTEFHKISESTIIKLILDGTSHDVLIRDFQENIISGKVLHIDFYEIERGKQLRTNVSLHLKGASIGVKEGGLLEAFVHELEVECLPKDLPENIELDIADLQLGHSIHVSEVPTPDGVRILNSSDQVVCTVVHKRVEEVEVVEEEAEVVEEPEEEGIEEE